MHFLETENSTEAEQLEFCWLWCCFCENESIFLSLVPRYCGVAIQNRADFTGGYTSAIFYLLIVKKIVPA